MKIAGLSYRLRTRFPIWQDGFDSHIPLMNNYKVGDKVKVRNSEFFKNHPKATYLGDIHVGSTFVQDMSYYCGEILTIEKIKSRTNKEMFFEVRENFFYWDPWMMEDPVDKKGNYLLMF